MALCLAGSWWASKRGFPAAADVCLGSILSLTSFTLLALHDRLVVSTQARISCSSWASSRPGGCRLALVLLEIIYIWEKVRGEELSLDWLQGFVCLEVCGAVMVVLVLVSPAFIHREKKIAHSFVLCRIAKLAFFFFRVGAMFWALRGGARSVGMARNIF